MLPPLHICLLSFTCISMSLYIFIIILILIYRSKISLLRNSFFKLVLSYASFFCNLFHHFQFIGDFFYFCEFTSFMRGRKYGWFNGILTPNSTAFLVVPVFSNSFHYYCKIVIYIGQILFASNRLSSAIFIMKYEKVGRFYFYYLNSIGLGTDCYCSELFNLFFLSFL